MNGKEVLEQNAIIKELVIEFEKFNLSFSIEISSIPQLKKELSGILNYLITTDFSRLIAILYRLDISEKKLKESLRTTVDRSAGDIVADMIVERQAQKIITRKSLKSNDSSCNEEKW